MTFVIFFGAISGEDRFSLQILRTYDTKEEYHRVRMEPNTGASSGVNCPGGNFDERKKSAPGSFLRCV
jgi:hypothetical protein